MIILTRYNNPQRSHYNRITSYDSCHPLQAWVSGMEVPRGAGRQLPESTQLTGGPNVE